MERNEGLKIGILGPGAVGGFLAVVLERSGIKTLCVGQEEETEIISKMGITLESDAFGCFTARPFAETLLSGEPDILFVTTKADALTPALQKVPAEKLGRAIVIPLLNGLEHMALLREHCGERVAAGAIGGFEAERIPPNLVRHYSKVPHITLSSDRGVGGEELLSVAELLSGAGIKVKILKSEAEVLWSKLVRLGPVSTVITASRRPLGAARRDTYWREILESCVKEAVNAANAQGLKFRMEKVLDDIDALPPTLYTSMYRDLATGRALELDAIAGAIVRAGVRSGISCPTIEELIERIRGEKPSAQ